MVKKAGSAIFVLHGWAYSTEKWKPFLLALSKQGINPVMLKIPGLTEKIDRVWDINDYIEWLRECIGSKQSFFPSENKQSFSTNKPDGFSSNKKAVLIGHSNGGRIALAFALKYPEKIERVVLIDSAGIRNNEVAARFKRAVFRNVAKLGKKIGVPKTARPLLYKLAREHDYEIAEPIVRETMKNLISVDLFPQLHKIIVPTTIIWGEDDMVTPLSHGKLMKKLIPASTLHIISGARHSPQFTHVEEVVKIIVEAINIV